VTVVGVTGEAKGPTEKWISEKGAKFGYAYDKGGKFARLAGVKAIPHMLVMDATGKVLMNGEHATEDALRQAAAGAIKRPLWELPKEFAKVRAGVAKGDFASALKECGNLAKKEALAQDAEATSKALQSLIDGRLEAAKAAATAGDWASAKAAYEALAKGCVGLPAEKTAKEALSEMSKNAEAQKGLKLQKALDALLEMPEKKDKDRAAKADALDAFAKKNDGTFAGKRAAEAATALRSAE
jgi:hypothetical protein